MQAVFKKMGNIVSRRRIVHTKWNRIKRVRNWVWFGVWVRWHVVYCFMNNGLMPQNKCVVPNACSTHIHASNFAWFFPLSVPFFIINSKCEHSSFHFTSFLHAPSIYVCYFYFFVASLTTEFFTNALIVNSASSRASFYTNQKFYLVTGISSKSITQTIFRV